MATMSYISIKGLEVALNELLKLNIINISMHANKLKNFLSNQLEESRWNLYRSEDDISASSHIISLESFSHNIHNQVEKLKTNAIICGIRNNRIRISISHYNNQTDIEKLINALS
jgi:selenocysteine lyase/cysteine desulfurase